ncbi:MAG: TetR/AcrR family transcriptional regulator [Actinomycetota bacterium]|nr:TetR/AcrR family transcriptional regulator [Actinomycetota bacterium]
MPKAAAANTSTRTDNGATPTDNAHVAPRSRKGVQTRSRLIEAARGVFERDGFLTARISDIAATAGLSQGSFYHYFDSKEQIFREVAEAQERRLTAPGDPGLEADADDSPRAVIGRANRRYLERYRDSAKLMGVIEQVSRYDEHVNAARIATMQHFVERAERSIRRLQRAGLADKKVNPRIAADALGSMVGRFAELWMVQGYRDYDFDEAVEQLTRLWANALGIEPSNAAPSVTRSRSRNRK